MKIAICDDEQQAAEKTTGILNTLTGKEAFDITVCASGEELIEKHDEERFDIIFLDIMLGGMNGMEAAKRIRNTDRRVIIVFLTNFQEFAAQGYEVGAFRYFVKNQSDSFYEEKFREVIAEYYINHKTFEIIGKNLRSYILLNDIYYLEVHSKRITVHTADAVYEYTGTLSEAEGQIMSGNIFVRSHKSYLVNVSKIASIGRSTVVLKNGAELALSRTCKKRLTDSYTAFMTGR